jgi:hypothetical protein
MHMLPKINVTSENNIKSQSNRWIIYIIWKPTMSSTELLKSKIYCFRHIQQTEPLKRVCTQWRSINYLIFTWRNSKTWSNRSVIHITIKLAALSMRLLKTKCNSFICIRQIEEKVRQRGMWTHLSTPCWQG